MSLHDNILKSWLPTIWSRLIAGSTIVTTGATLYLPEFLQKYGIQSSRENTLLIRATVPLSILWIGTLLVLLLVLHHFKKLTMRLNMETYTYNPAGYYVHKGTKEHLCPRCLKIDHIEAPLCIADEILKCSVCNKRIM